MNESNIELQLEVISKKLDRLTNPFKVAGLQFTAGLFHSLGNLIGTVLLTLLAVYFVSLLHINFGQMFTNYIQSLIPKPQFTIQNPFQ